MLLKNVEMLKKCEGVVFLISRYDNFFSRKIIESYFFYVIINI